MKLEKIIDSTNVAESLKEDKLQKIGDDAVSGYESDLLSRKPWEEDLKNWTDLALQIAAAKTFPWPNTVLSP